jgi:hypothetical protein
MKARIHPGRPAQIAVAAFVFLAFCQPVSAQLSNQWVGGKFSGYAGVEPQINQAHVTTTGVLSNYLSFYDTGPDNYAYSQHFAEIDGPSYGVSSFAAGISRSTSNVGKRLTYTAEATGTYSLSTFIEAGSLDVTAMGGAAGSGSAGFEWSIQINDDLYAAQSQVDLNFTTASTGSSSITSSFTTPFNDYTEAFSLTNGLLVSWSGTTLSNVWQGFLNAGESVDVTFLASSYALANFSDVNSTFGIGCYGNISNIFGEVASPCGSSTVSFGDPAVFSSPQGNIRHLAYLSNTVFDFTPTTAVPEPGEWAMMLAGLGTVGLIARRRRKLAETQ